MMTGISPEQQQQHYCSPSRDSVIASASQVSTPSMKAMIPLAMDELLQHTHHLHHSSSTESAQDQMELMDSNSRTGADITPTRKRPSKIPLPGTKGYLAPKPPTGRTQATVTGLASRISPSGPPSNRSLSKSTGSLIGRSGPSSITKKDLSPSMNNRPESAQSLRKDSSLSNCSRSSSIPVSSKINTPTRLSNSPLPKPKRESFTSRVRNMDSLTRIQATSPSYANSGSTTTLYKSASKKDLNTSNNSSTTALYKSTSKKDLSSSFSTGQTRDRKQNAPSVRRVNSASVGRVNSGTGGSSGGNGTATGNNGIDISSSVSASTDNEKVPNFRTRLWNMLKI